MTTSSTTLNQNTIVESFWNLLQTVDSKARRALYKRLENEYYAERSRNSRSLSDESLAQELSEFDPITEQDFPELSREQYVGFARNSSGKIAKGLEKWL